MASGPGVRRSRANAWLRDELILALDLYIREGAGAPLASREELSATLRAFPIEAHLASSPTFRSLASVSTKLANFLAIDPSSPGGLTHGGAGDAEVCHEFSDNPERLHQTAEAIRASLTAAPGDLALEDDDDLVEAEEGRLLTGQHRRRERSRRLVARKKAQALIKHGFSHVKRATSISPLSMENAGMVSSSATTLKPFPTFGLGNGRGLLTLPWSARTATA